MSEAAQQPEVPERVLDYLREHETLTLATATRTGVPRAATLTYASDGITVYVWLHPDSTTAGNIAQNPIVSFAIDEYSPDWRKTRGIQGTGEADVILRPEELSRAVELFAEKFPSLERGQPANVSFFRISPSDIQFIEGSDSEEGRDQQFGVEYNRDAVYSVFRDLPARDLATVAGRLQTVNVDPGSVVVRQGAPADKFFIIVEGEVEVLREDDGEERTLNVLGAGDYFGEVAILRDSSRIATVKATAPTTLLAMDRDTLRSLVAGSLGTTEQFDRVIRERMTAAGQTAE
jgi:nitroimidazol reductase NimA-like FMN-containing flavoprotein (pyridoxamine 5'-phosphate oxidase superfamily)